jgi:hypothetical protein
VRRTIGRVLDGSIDSSGDLTFTQRLFSILVGGSMGFSGAVTKQVRKGLRGVLDFVGDYIRRLVGDTPITISIDVAEISATIDVLTMALEIDLLESTLDAAVLEIAPAPEAMIPGFDLEVRTLEEELAALVPAQTAEAVSRNLSMEVVVPEIDTVSVAPGVSAEQEDPASTELPVLEVVQTDRSH